MFNPQSAKAKRKANKISYARKKHLEDLLIPAPLADFLKNPELLPKKPPQRAK